MINNGSEVSETEENDAPNTGSEKPVPYEPTSTNDNYASRKKRRVDAFSQVTSSTSSFIEIEPSISSIQLIQSTKRHNIYCISTPDGMRALKTTLTDNPSIDDIQNLDNELKIGSQITHHAFRKCYGRTIYQNKKALVLEWEDCNPLTDYAKSAVPNFFQIAREMVSCLLALHSNKVCHLNLTCDHFLFNPESNSIKIIGCGSCSSFCSKQNYNPMLLEKDLRFISPEQTGRVNRDVDFRSDFYSLGIVFYYLLTGVYPFESSNASKIVKMHIFQEPTPLHVIDPNIPLPVSDMVSKLMAKNAAERYQSAKGIMHDVDLIISEYKQGFELTLAQHDLSEILILPQKLYGRDSEYHTLLSVNDKVVESSSFELVLVKASSGMGKSALVLELMKPTLQKGMLIHGKFDCSNFEPYSALTEAVNMFCDNIALEDEITREKYRLLIQDAVGEEGQLLTNTIFSLKTVIGEQRDTFESFGLDAKNRFEYVFVKFLKAIASINSPLVLVIDDLQWADLASLQLIKALIKSSIQNLMLIGLYRDNEMNSEHPMVNFLHEVDNIDVSITEIKLDNMDSECVNEFISDALRISPLDSYPLTALIHKNTAGNPFFVKQMIHNLWEQEIISFSFEKGKWQWDLDGNDLAENISDLLRQKILSMNNQSQEALKVASCLESPFSLSSLVLIINDTKGVEDAIASGIINQEKGSDKCCFVHDQFKHAAKSLLPENPKPLYLSLARKLSKLLSSVDLEDSIVDVTNLYYSAKDVIDENEHFEVAELFLLAGESKFKITAFDKAMKYFEAGIELLDEDVWQTNYEFCLKIHNYAAKSAYCERNYNRMNELIGEISKNASSLLDLVTSYLLIMKMHNDNRMHEDAIQVGHEIVEKLGEKIESNQFIIDLEMERTKNLILGSMDNVMKIQEMKDRRLLSIMEILNTLLLSCVFVGDQHVLATMALKMVQLTFAYGINRYSSLGFCAFASVLCYNEDCSSIDIGKLSLRLLEKTNAKMLIPKVNLWFFAAISPFFAPLQKSLIPLKKMSRASLEIGSHHFAATSVATYSLYSFYCGESLLKLIDDMVQCEEMFPLKTKIHLAVYQAALNLHNINIENPARLKGEIFDYESCIDEKAAKTDIVLTSTLCSTVAYLFDDIQKAYELLGKCKPLLKYFGYTYLEVVFYFNEGLILLDIVRRYGRNDVLLQIIQNSISALECYCENAPQNNLHKLYLVKAELAVIQNEESDAKSYYEKSISLAKENGFVNEAAIACERAALFYYDLDLEEHAIELLVQSCEYYKAWGSVSKISHLMGIYPVLIERLKDAPTTSNTDFQDTSINNHDAESVSAVTDAFSSTSISVWQEQKQLIKNLVD